MAGNTAGSIVIDIVAKTGELQTDIDRAQSSIDKLQRQLQKFQKETAASGKEFQRNFVGPLREGESAVGRFNATLNRGSDGAARLGKSMQQSQAGFRSANLAIQNTSYQITDFVMQVSGGVDAMRAFSQQAPQLLGGFGPKGAVVGMFVGLAAAFAPMIMSFMQSAEEAKKASDVFKELDERTGNLAASVQDVTNIDLSSLGRSYREATDEGKDLIDANITLQLELLRLAQIDALANFRLGVQAAIDEVSSFKLSLMDIIDRLIPAYKQAMAKPGDIGGFVKKDTIDQFASLNDISRETALNLDKAKKAFGEGSITAASYVRTLQDALKSTKSPSKDFVKQIIAEQEYANQLARAKGEYQARSAAQAAGYRGLEKPSASRQDNTQEKMFNNMRVGADKFEQSMIRANQQVAHQASLLGKTSQEMEVLNAQYKIQSEQEKVIQDIIIQNGFIRDAELQRINAAAAAAIATQTAMITSRQETERSALYGMTTSMQNYFNNATNMAKNVEGVFTQAFDGMSSAIVDFAMTGKMSFSDFANAVISDIMRIYVRMALIGLAKSAIGAFAGNAFPNGPEITPMGDNFADGGYTGDGGKYQPAGIVHAGEFVMNKEATSRIGVGNLYRMMRGYAYGGLVGSGPLTGPGSNNGNVTINIKNEAGGDGYQATATARKNESGLDVEVLVRKVMSDDLRRNGPMAQQMTNTFGLRRSM